MSRLLVLLEYLLVLPVVAQWSGHFGKEELGFIATLVGCCDKLLTCNRFYIVFRILVDTVKTESSVLF